jgi:hypothetical protein
MKSNINENRNRLARKLLALGSVFVLAAAAFGAGVYSNSLREIDDRMQDSMVLDRLVQASKFNLLIQNLNGGKAAETRQLLKIMLADDLQEAKRLAATATPAGVAQLKFTMMDIGRQEKAHPEYYTLEQPVRASGTMQIARHDVKP